MRAVRNGTRPRGLRYVTDTRRMPLQCCAGYCPVQQASTVLVGGLRKAQERRQAKGVSNCGHGYCIDCEEMLLHKCARSTIRLAPHKISAVTGSIGVHGAPTGDRISTRDPLTPETKSPRDQQLQRETAPDTNSLVRPFSSRAPLTPETNSSSDQQPQRTQLQRPTSTIYQA